MKTRPKTGLEIDGFTLGDMLHRGGFATIWEVTHPDHSGRMVMKVPTILDGDDGPTIVGFETEQMILPRLTGPHVPKVIAAGDFSAMPYLVTEKLPGGPLQDLIREAPLPVARVVELGRGMAAMLHDLHRQHVIHLDLKPGNVMWRETGEMVAIDYGLARHDQLPDLLAEEFTIPMGTFPYIAPEQFLHQRNDLRSDIFALGVMLYELATGKLPFGHPQTLRGVRKRLWRDPEPPRALKGDLPPWLQEIILRALEIDPARRTQSAAQLLFDLEHPDQVELTARAGRETRDGFWTVLRRRWKMRRVKRFAAPPPLVAEQSARAPVLMAAVDLSPAMEPLSERVLHAVRDILIIRPEARVACVNVIRTHRIGLDQATDDQGNHIHIARLVALKAWGERLGLPEGRVTFTVLEGPDPGAELIEHSARIMADHVVMGARANSAARRYLGSVSSQVVAQAPCSVTIVRIPQPREG